MILSIGIVQARPQHAEELGRRMAALVDPTSREPGCVTYDLYRSSEDDGIWIFCERWETAADLDAHVESAHLRDFAAHLDEVAAGPPQSYRATLVVASPRHDAPPTPDDHNREDEDA